MTALPRPEPAGSALARQVKGALGALVQPLSVIALAMVAVLVLLILTGYDPANVFNAMSRSLGKDLGGTLRWTTPLILTGVAASLAFRANAMNIGVDGQIYLGGVFATFVALGPASTLPGAIGIPLVILAGVVGGALWALIPAVLRVRFGADELVTTILLITIASLLVQYLVLGPLAPPGVDISTLGTAKFAEGLWLPIIVPASTANAGLFLSIVVAIGMAFLFYRTTIGYNLKMVGQNARFAVYGGVNHVRTFLFAMVGSGAIGGLVGGMELLGVMHRMPSGFNPGLGFDGIVVALLARNNPIGCILAAFFFGALRSASLNMERFSSTPREIVQIVEAFVVLAVSARVGLEIVRRRRRAGPPVPPSPTRDADEAAPLAAAAGLEPRA